MKNPTVTVEIAARFFESAPCGQARNDTDMRFLSLRAPHLILRMYKKENSTLIPNTIKLCTFVISTGRPRSGLQAEKSGIRNQSMYSNQISRLRCALLEMTQASAVTNLKSYNVIAKERSDCGNLNPYAAKTVYFFRRSTATKRSRLFQQARRLLLIFDNGCGLLGACYARR